MWALVKFAVCRLMRMKIKDKIRFLLAKISSRETVLFSSKDDWEKVMKNNITGYVPFFYEFDKINSQYFDIIIPLTLHAQIYINAHRELFAEKTYLCPSDYSMEICDDKKKFHSHLSSHGFRKYLPEIDKKFDYPYVLKKKKGAWGEGISIITDMKNERRYMTELKSEEYFTQQYIKGRNEYTAHIIFADRMIVFFRVLKFTFQDEQYIKGMGFTPISVEKTKHEKYKQIFADILSQLNYEGICCFNYKITEDGLRIFEINPRFGASMNYFINEAITHYNIYGKNNARSNREI